MKKQGGGLVKSILIASPHKFQIMQCFQCKKEFEPLRQSARYCCAACRLKAFKRNADLVNKDAGTKHIETLSTETLSKETLTRNAKETLSDNDVTLESSDYIPNWKRAGHKTKEEAKQAILKQLKKDTKKIMKHSLTKELDMLAFGERCRLVL